jgi:hypothetical protein
VGARELEGTSSRLDSVFLSAKFSVCSIIGVKRKEIV